MELPPALARGSDTFAELRPTLTDLQRLVAELAPVAPELAPFMRRLAGFADTARPTVAELRRMLGEPGAGNDLVDALLDCPALARLSETALPHTRRALRDAEPIFAFARPYTPDLAAWMRSFGGAMAPYDANGHYARTMAVFDAFEFVDDAGGRAPRPEGSRGRAGKSPNLTPGNLRRCPGAGDAPAGGRVGAVRRQRRALEPRLRPEPHGGGDP